MQLKLIDFGTAINTQSDLERRFSVCGHVEYQAPEMISTAKNGYDSKIEVWQFGIILYQLLVGKVPYPVRLGVNDVAVKIDYDPTLIWPTDIKISIEAKNLIGKCLN